MESININQLVKDEIYYIESKTNKKSRQIAKFKDVTYYRDEKYVANFTDISEIKKSSGFGNSGLHYGDGSRHSYWFTFYKNYKINYNRKIENFYKTAINKFLQEITGDCNFIWY